MRARRQQPGCHFVIGAALMLAASLLAAGCGAGAPANISTPLASATAIPSPARSASSEPLLDWPEFGLNPQRSDVSELPTGITAANVGHLRHMTVALPGTVDSSPIYLHGVTVDGAVHDAIVVTTTYGKTLAIDANSGQDPVDLHPARLPQLGRQRADHHRQPPGGPRPPVRLCRIAQRADPQALVGRRQRGLAAAAGR